jgi:hypothetical protein
MFLSPSFYEPPGSPPTSRKGIGLNNETMTLLIRFGGYGSAVASKILDHLDGYGSQFSRSCCADATTSGSQA